MFFEFRASCAYPYLFHLREQLHTYLDVIETHQYLFGGCLGLDSLRSIYREKRDMVQAVEADWLAQPFPQTFPEASYALLKRPWLEAPCTMMTLRKQNHVGRLLRAEHFLQDHILLILEATDARTSTRELMCELEGRSVGRLCLLRRLLKAL